MNPTPSIEASPAIQLHLATIAVAVAATLLILPLKKGTRVHKLVGWVWAVSMMATALISLGINTLGSPIWLNPIHVFSFVVLFNVPYAIISIRRGNVTAHRAAMLGVTIGALGIAGAMTFLPGRIMWEVFLA